MIYNGEIYRQASEIINEIRRINFEYGGKIPQKSIDKMGANLIVNLLEKQKDNMFSSQIRL